MDVVGVGVDLVEVDRMRRTVARTPGFVDRVFTAGERDWCRRVPDPAERFAARFAAKEAVAKALGAPPGLAHREAEVRRDPDGRPHLHLSGRAAEVAAGLGVARWHVSLSHDAGVAIAYVIAEGGTGGRTADIPPGAGRAG